MLRGRQEFMRTDTKDELQQLRDENADLKNELEETRADSNRYLQNIAHQLTAPLGAIKWSIEALKDERVPLARKKTLLSSVYSQATILVHLIKNFTLMSNLEADHELGQFREQPEPIDIMRLAINLANDFQPQAHEKDIKIIVNNDSFSRVFGKLRLRVEKNLTAQAISNILENAVKYASSQTNIDIAAVDTVQQSVGLAVGLAIQSSGIPISNSDKEKLFARGFRGNSAKQKVPAGTGIGLFLASRVAELHGGSIVAETDNRVSRFIMIFPRSRFTDQ